MPVMQLSEEMRLFAEMIEQADTWDKKKEILSRARLDRNFLIIFDLCFNPNILFSRVPVGMPSNLKPEDMGESEGLLKFHINREKYLYFIDGKNDGIREHKLNLMYRNLLESLPVEDRHFIASIYQKVFPYPAITYELVWDTFTEFTFSWPAPETNERASSTKEVPAETVSVIEDAANSAQFDDFPELAIPGGSPVEIPHVTIDWSKKVGVDETEDAPIAAKSVVSKSNTKGEKTKKPAPKTKSATPAKSKGKSETPNKA